MAAQWRYAGAAEKIGVKSIIKAYLGSRILAPSDMRAGYFSPRKIAARQMP
jgi:hypothetical protein